MGDARFIGADPAGLSLSPVAPGRTSYLSAYLERAADVIDSLDLKDVARVVDCMLGAWQRRATIFVAGNGGSASTASHMANDLVKATFVQGMKPVRAISLMDNVSLLTALANDHAYETAVVEQLVALASPGDVLVLLSASGNSENLVSAAKHAAKLSVESVALVGFTGGALAKICDFVVHARSEVGEYGPVEDVHLMLDHMITGAMRECIAREID